ncbi:MAG: CRISPR-associated endonuclease Cas2 [Verrucomicrobiae bacterium]|nr:CRISPR-associated endonuclease Cas2 [Verrucomicrobiae bacterium]
MSEEFQDDLERRSPIWHEEMDSEHAGPEAGAPDEDLLPDERPRRQKYDEPLTLSLSPSVGERESARTGEGQMNDLISPAGLSESEPPFQLQPSTAVEKSRRKSRGKQGRNPVCSKYRMAWVMVFFDLPVGTPEERRDAANFRKDLIKDGYMMVQFSVYARPCGSADRVETQVRRLRSKIPSRGEVRGLLITDAQWGRMIVVRSQQKEKPEDMPEQMMFF